MNGVDILRFQETSQASTQINPRLIFQTVIKKIGGGENVTFELQTHTAHI
jgi:hypothetical protein